MHAGKQLMQMWDRLCHLLRMRQISVEDVSNKVVRALALSILSPRHPHLRASCCITAVPLGTGMLLMSLEHALYA